MTFHRKLWKEVSNELKVESGVGDSGCIFGNYSETKSIDSYAEWDSANKGSSISWDTNHWSNDVSLGSNLVSGKTATASGSHGSFPPSNAIDGNLNTTWYYPVSGNQWLKVDFGVSTSFSLCKFIAFDQLNCRIVKIETSENDSSWTEIWSGSEYMYAYTTGIFISISASGTGRYVKFTTNGASENTIAEVQVYNPGYASTNNTVPTIEMCTGTQSFVPSSLKLYTTTAKSVELTDGQATVSFRKTIGGVTTDYSTQESLNTFKARPVSEFASCTSFKVKAQPVSSNTVGAVEISTVSSGVVQSKSGALSVEVNGSTMIELQADGDGVFADISADDITMTGDLSIDTTKTTIATATTTDATPTVIKAISVAADKTISIDVDVIGNKASTATKAAYRLIGSFYRNGSGNVTAISDTVSLTTDEADTDWDVSLVANTSNQTIDVTITGKAATTIAWSAKITYNIA